VPDREGGGSIQSIRGVVIRVVARAMITIMENNVGERMERFQGLRL
jgi:hypothetical protein